MKTKISGTLDTQCENEAEVQLMIRALNYAKDTMPDTSSAEKALLGDAAGYLNAAPPLT